MCGNASISTSAWNASTASKRNFPPARSAHLMESWNRDFLAEPETVAVLAFAAPLEGWPKNHTEDRAAYSRQIPALIVDWLDASTDLSPGLAILTKPLPHTLGSLAWVLPERMLEPDELVNESEALPRADILIDGKIRREGRDLEIHVRVMRPDSGLVLTELEARCRLRGVVPATRELAQRVVGALSRSPLKSQDSTALFAASDRAADLYMLGRDLELAFRSGVDPGTGRSPAGSVGRALELSPRFEPAVELLLEWARFAGAEDGDPTHAEQVLLGLERATANAEADPRLWAARGLLAARWTRDPEHAITVINEALDHGGDSLALRIEIAERLVEQGRLPAARGHLLRAADRCQNDPRLLDEVGVMLGNAGAIARASELWRRGAELAPWEGSFFAQLGRAAAIRGDHDEAWRYYGQALVAADLPAQIFDYVRELARTTAVPTVVRERVADLKLGAQAELSTQLELGELCVTIGQEDRARELFLAALERSEDEDEEAEVRARRGLLEAARPGSGERIQELVSGGGLAADPRRARDEILGMIAAEPDFWPLWLLRGLSERHLGAIDQAIASLRRAVELAPRQVGPIRALGRTLLRHKRPVEAVDSLRRASVLVPRDAGLRVELARALFLANRADEAALELDAAARIAPLRWSGLWLRLGLSLHRLFARPDRHRGSSTTESAD